jgi:putative membrane protein
MLKLPSAIIIALVAAGAASAALAPAEFVKKAGASDLYEITSSKLVASSGNPNLRTFAAMMIKDHTKSTADVKAAAIKSGLKPMPPALDPKQAADVAALKKVSGATRDRLYISQQKAAHQAALALHQENAADGGAPALKAASAKIVPVVQHHIHQLSGM